MNLEVIFARDQPCGIDAVCLDDRGEHVERRIWRGIVDRHPERHLIDLQLPRDALKVADVQRRDETSDASSDGFRVGAGIVHRGKPPQSACLGSTGVRLGALLPPVGAQASSFPRDVAALPVLPAVGAVVKRVFAYFILVQTQ